MSQPIVFSIVESPTHKNFSGLYQKFGLKEVRLNSIRKANAELKKQLPDLVVAEFFYGYGSNYSGVHISNLDVFLVTLVKYHAQPKIIVLVDKSEADYVHQLNEIYPISHILKHPVKENEMKPVLEHYYG
jgi:hypothetical protein